MVVLHHRSKSKFPFQIAFFPLLFMLLFKSMQLKLLVQQQIWQKPKNYNKKPWSEKMQQY